MGKRRYQAIMGMPVGAVGVLCAGGQLVRIDYLPHQPDVSTDDPTAIAVVEQLRGWLEDPFSRFDLPLALAGTAFQQRVWQAIVAVPCGSTRTYGDLAQALHSAQRAVGQACGANPYPIVVPCHRIVARSKTFNGGIGGFSNATDGYLLDIKRWLLAREAEASSMSARVRRRA